MSLPHAPCDIIPADGWGCFPVTRDAFVIMPFSSTPTCTEAQWTETYDYVFKPAFLEAGYSCERAKPMVGHVLNSIVESLRGSRIVLADITDRNPNVFYELGIRHTLKKGTIIVSRDGQIPSDLGGIWYVRYENSPTGVAKFKNEINRLTQEIEQKPDRTDNPVMEYLDREKLSVSGFGRRANFLRGPRPNGKQTSSLKGSTSGTINLNNFPSGKEHSQHWWKCVVKRFGRC